MKENSTKAKLLSGKPAVGVLSDSRDPGTAEVIGLLGFDFYMVDGEHSSLGPAQVVDIVRACDLTGVTPLARVRSIDEKLLLQFLDTGIMGVMMPGILKTEDVEELVSAVKYPPLGRRGLGPSRAADYFMGPMPQAEYVAFANRQTLVLPQIEDIEALDHLEEMIGVEGVDGFVIGPRDLAMSMGFYDGPGHEEVEAAIDRVFDVVLARGLILGTVAGTGQAAKKLISRGALFCLTSVQGLLKFAGSAYFDGMKP